MLGRFPGLLRGLSQERFALLERLLRLARGGLHTFLQRLRERHQRIFGQVDDVLNALLRHVSRCVDALAGLLCQLVHIAVHVLADVQGATRGKDGAQTGGHQRRTAQQARYIVDVNLDVPPTARGGLWRPVRMPAEQLQQAIPWAGLALGVAVAAHDVLRRARGFGPQDTQCSCGGALHVAERATQCVTCLFGRPTTASYHGQPLLRTSTGQDGGKMCASRKNARPGTLTQRVTGAAPHGRALLAHITVPRTHHNRVSAISDQPSAAG